MGVLVKQSGMDPGIINQSKGIAIHAPRHTRIPLPRITTANNSRIGSQVQSGQVSAVGVLVKQSGMDPGIINQSKGIAIHAPRHTRIPLPRITTANNSRIDVESGDRRIGGIVAARGCCNDESSR